MAENKVTVSSGNKTVALPGFDSTQTRNKVIELGGKLANVENQLGKLKLAKKTLVSQILELIHEPEMFLVNEHQAMIVDWKPARIDQDKLKQLFPPTQVQKPTLNDRLYKEQGQMKAVKAYLTPAQVKKILADPELGVKIK